MQDLINSSYWSRSQEETKLTRMVSYRDFNKRNTYRWVGSISGMNKGSGFQRTAIIGRCHYLTSQGTEILVASRSRSHGSEDNHNFRQGVRQKQRGSRKEMPLSPRALPMPPILCLSWDIEQNREGQRNGGGRHGQQKIANILDFLHFILRKMGIL